MRFFWGFVLGCLFTLSRGDSWSGRMVNWFAVRVLDGAQIALNEARASVEPKKCVPGIENGVQRICITKSEEELRK